MTSQLFETPSDRIAFLTDRYADIDKRHIKLESMLYGRKWWDYRRLHPADSTERFAQAYITALKLDFSQRIDIERSQYYKGLKHTDDITMNGPRVLSGLWRARQQADNLGIPYEFYCYEAIRYCADKHWHYLPKTWQMYSTTKDEDGLSMVSHIKKCWHARKVLKAPEDLFYTNPHWKGHMYQQKWQRYLVKYVRRTPHKAVVLSELIYDRSLMMEPIAVKAFGGDVIRKAEKLSA